MPTADRDAFLAAMSGAVTSVNVVTTSGPAGLYGVTVSAVASVSADPPMILSCVNRRSPAADAILANGIFCVNLLADHQAHISDVFAGRSRTHEPFSFACAEWHTGVTGAAILPGAVASFDCVLDAAHDAGTHKIFIGRVLSTHAGEGKPLAHCRRAYCSPAALTKAS
ncbi:flavin reductase family protein [Rhodoligotrophos defluvii]|uniref:flavin reductase family protein n=1 Tax=Rhodoligotrophos defluvii TaxID=2561934 RepID=UPI001484ED9D|nr:flavin reductase family protein [Rhodoligotrophos defluvii]